MTGFDLVVVTAANAAQARGYRAQLRGRRGYMVVPDPGGRRVGSLGATVNALRLLRDGDYIQMVNTTKKIQIREADTVTIQGVYNINKGYAVFREVTVIDENEEFCIVEADNIYSLAPHDRIVLDASQADTDEIVL